MAIDATIISIREARTARGGEDISAAEGWRGIGNPKATTDVLAFRGTDGIALNVGLSDRLAGFRNETTPRVC